MDFRRLREEVAERNKIDDAVIAALTGYAQAVREAAEQGATVEELNKIADEMDAMNARMANAVLANTGVDVNASTDNTGTDAGAGDQGTENTTGQTGGEQHGEGDADTSTEGAATDGHPVEPGHI